MNMNVEIDDRVTKPPPELPTAKSPIVSIVNVSKTYARGNLVALDRCRVSGWPRRVHRHSRPQRGRKVNLAALHQSPGAAN